MLFYIPARMDTWWLKFQACPAGVSHGRDCEEALENISEAIALYEEVLQERGEPIPNDSIEIVEVAA